MYTNNFDGTDPEKYMAGWLCDDDLRSRRTAGSAPTFPAICYGGI